MAGTTLEGFVAAMFLMSGYVAGLAFLLVGAMTVALPDRGRRWALTPSQLCTSKRSSETRSQSLRWHFGVSPVG